MKKKVRDITVDGVKYAWNVFVGMDESGYVKYFKIWKNNKVIISGDVDNRITPSEICKKIKELNNTNE